MSDKKNKQETENLQNEEIDATTNIDNTDTTTSEAEPSLSPEEEIAKLKEELEKEKKEYLFLMAEFDNFRKRVIREKAEIIKNAKGQALEELLPIIDDFERGIKAAADTDNAEAVREGIELIYAKFVKYLNKNGITAIETADQKFNEEFHEAISIVNIPDENLKGKIIDTVEKGYMLNDKVLRYAKVVVGQ